MIGRESELRQVKSLLDGAGRGTRGLLLQGEAGIGKTTIWHAALDAAAGRGYRVVVTAFEEHARTYGSPWLIGEALRVQARMLAATGDQDGADAAVAEAEALHRRMEDPWELARTLLVAGEVHRRARRRARASAALREALEIFMFLGARMWATHAREQLGRIGAAREDGGLTPTQRRVAELAATGLTNRQVADRLSMSAHTVEAHLSAAYRALNIRSRGQLSEALASPGTAARDSPGSSRDSAPS